jgi:hypothetical protein
MPRPQRLPQNLAALEQLQRIGYEVALLVDSELREGMSESDAAQLLRTESAARGLTDVVAGPHALFGARTAIDPSDGACEGGVRSQRLSPGMGVILEIALRSDGNVSHVAYTTAFGENPEVDALRRDLARLRAPILQSFRLDEPERSVREAVDRVLSSCSRAGVEQLRDSRPLLSRAALDGVWLVAPRIRRGELGAAWAELFVATGSGARWLDEDLANAGCFGFEVSSARGR